MDRLCYAVLWLTISLICDETFIRRRRKQVFTITQEPLLKYIPFTHVIVAFYTSPSHFFFFFLSCISFSFFSFSLLSPSLCFLSFSPLSIFDRLNLSLHFFFLSFSLSHTTHKYTIHSFEWTTTLVFDITICRNILLVD